MLSQKTAPKTMCSNMHKSLYYRAIDDEDADMHQVEHNLLHIHIYNFD